MRKCELKQKISILNKMQNCSETSPEIEIVYDIKNAAETNVKNENSSSVVNTIEPKQELLVHKELNNPECINIDDNSDDDVECLGSFRSSTIQPENTHSSEVKEEQSPGEVHQQNNACTLQFHGKETNRSQNFETVWMESVEFVKNTDLANPIVTSTPGPKEKSSCALETIHKTTRPICSDPSGTSSIARSFGLNSQPVNLPPEVVPTSNIVTHKINCSSLVGSVTEPQIRDQASVAAVEVKHKVKRFATIPAKFLAGRTVAQVINDPSSGSRLFKFVKPQTINNSNVKQLHEAVALDGIKTIIKKNLKVSKRPITKREKATMVKGAIRNASESCQNIIFGLKNPCNRPTISPRSLLLQNNPGYPSAISPMMADLNKNHGNTSPISQTNMVLQQNTDISPATFPITIVIPKNPNIEVNEIESQKPPSMLLLGTKLIKLKGIKQKESQSKELSSKNSEDQCCEKEKTAMNVVDKACQTSIYSWIYKNANLYSFINGGREVNIEKVRRVTLAKPHVETSCPNPVSSNDSKWSDDKNSDSGKPLECDRSSNITLPRSRVASANSDISNRLTHQNLAFKPQNAFQQVLYSELGLCSSAPELVENSHTQPVGNQRTDFRGLCSSASELVENNKTQPVGNQRTDFRGLCSSASDLVENSHTQPVGNRRTDFRGLCSSASELVENSHTQPVGNRRTDFRGLWSSASELVENNHTQTVGNQTTDFTFDRQCILNNNLNFHEVNTNSNTTFDHEIGMLVASVQNNGLDPVAEPTVLPECNTQMSTSNTNRIVDVFNKLVEDIRTCLSCDALGNIPLHQAIIENDTAKLKSQCIVLKTIGSNLNHINLTHETALMLAVKEAVESGNYEAVSFLVSEGADQRIADQDGNTPLHIAVSRGCNPLVRVLLTGSDADQVTQKFNYEGLTPLHIAAMEGHDDIIKQLVSMTIFIDIKDRKNGRTPYYLAVKKRKWTSAELLKMFGASVNEPNFANQMPFLIDSIEENNAQENESINFPVSVFPNLIEIKLPPVQTKLPEESLSSQCPNADQSFPNVNKTVFNSPSHLVKISELDKGQDGSKKEVDQANANRLLIHKTVKVAGKRPDPLLFQTIKNKDKIVKSTKSSENKITDSYFESRRDRLNECDESDTPSVTIKSHSPIPVKRICLNESKLLTKPSQSDKCDNGSITLDDSSVICSNTVLTSPTCNQEQVLNVKESRLVYLEPSLHESQIHYEENIPLESTGVDVTEEGFSGVEHNENSIFRNPYTCEKDVNNKHITVDHNIHSTVLKNSSPLPQYSKSKHLSRLNHVYDKSANIVSSTGENLKHPHNYYTSNSNKTKKNRVHVETQSTVNCIDKPVHLNDNGLDISSNSNTKRNFEQKYKSLLGKINNLSEENQEMNQSYCEITNALVNTLVPNDCNTNSWEKLTPNLNQTIEPYNCNTNVSKELPHQGSANEAPKPNNSNITFSKEVSNQSVIKIPDHGNSITKMSEEMPNHKGNGAFKANDFNIGVNGDFHSRNPIEIFRPNQFNIKVSQELFCQSLNDTSNLKDSLSKVFQEMPYQTVIESPKSNQCNTKATRHMLSQGSNAISKHHNSYSKVSQKYHQNTIKIRDYNDSNSKVSNESPSQSANNIPEATDSNTTLSEELCQRVNDIPEPTDSNTRISEEPCQSVNDIPESTDSNTRISDERYQSIIDIPEPTDSNTRISEEPYQSIIDIPEPTDSNTRISEEPCQSVNDIPESTDSNTRISQEPYHSIIDIPEPTDSNTRISEEPCQSVNYIPESTDSNTRISEEPCQNVDDIPELKDSNTKISEEPCHRVNEILENSNLNDRISEEDCRSINEGPNPNQSNTMVSQEFPIQSVIKISKLRKVRKYLCGKRVSQISETTDFNTDVDSNFYSQSINETPKPNHSNPKVMGELCTTQDLNNITTTEQLDKEKHLLNSSEPFVEDLLPQNKTLELNSNCVSSDEEIISLDSELSFAIAGNVQDMIFQPNWDKTYQSHFSNVLTKENENDIVISYNELFETVVNKKNLENNSSENIQSRTIINQNRKRRRKEVNERKLENSFSENIQSSSNKNQDRKMRKKEENKKKVENNTSEHTQSNSNRNQNKKKMAEAKSKESLTVDVSSISKNQNYQKNVSKNKVLNNDFCDKVSNKTPILNRSTLRSKNVSSKDPKWKRQNKHSKVLDKIATFKFKDTLSSSTSSVPDALQFVSNIRKRLAPLLTESKNLSDSTKGSENIEKLSPPLTKRFVPTLPTSTKPNIGVEINSLTKPTVVLTRISRPDSTKNIPRETEKIITQKSHLKVPIGQKRISARISKKKVITNL